ncbi:MAG: UDP-3-O-(3-hydroxymyristoyl)glucosamine N-acyltransferase [Candidatus Omnitrophota bacterium]
MVTLNQFKATDPSFQIRSSGDITGDISTLCSLDCLMENGVVFIKNKKYYQKLQDIHTDADVIKNIGIIFPEEFLKGLNTSEVSAHLKKFRFYATVRSVDLAISRYSKLFFDELKTKWDDFTDGRTTGTARVHPSSSIAPDVFIAEGVEIAEHVIVHAGCVILSNSRIGKNTVLFPNVVLYRNVSIGQDCIIHGNTTIGSDGFGYNYDQGVHHKVWHFGGVSIGDSVEIGSTSSVAQGTFSPTIIGKGSKIDNQVHIAHNCILGKGVIICGQSGLAGSVTLGDYVVLGGAVNVAPNVVVGQGAQIGGMSGVTGHVPERAVYGGHPARPVSEWLKSSAFLRRISNRKNGKTTQK